MQAAIGHRSFQEFNIFVMKQSSNLDNENEFIPNDEENRVIDISWEALKVPLDDPRRQYVAKFFQYINCGDYENLSKFLHEFAAEDFYYHAKSVPTNNQKKGGSEPDPYLPKSLLISGVDSFVSFSTSIGDCVPDRFYTIEDSIIRNRADGTLLISKFVVMGTGVRELTMKLEPDNEFENDESSSYPSRIGKVRYTEFMTGGKDVALEDEHHFKAGGMLKCGVYSLRYEGTCTMTLSTTGKICSVVWDFSDERNANWINVFDE